MTTAFQTVFDNAESISINKRKTVAQTKARDGTVKTTSLGGQAWEFTVVPPSGPKWSVYRPLIERMEALDRVAVGQVQINHPNLTWLSGYQGDLTNVSSINVNYVSGNTVLITSGATLGSGFRFRSGDFIQLNTGSVYSVVNDVPFNENLIVLNRPVREAAGNYILRVGQAVVWNVICTQFPTWTIFARDQVSWDGAFVFAEAL